MTFTVSSITNKHAEITVPTAALRLQTLTDFLAEANKATITGVTVRPVVVSFITVGGVASIRFVVEETIDETGATPV